MPRQFLRYQRRVVWGLRAVAAFLVFGLVWVLVPHFPTASKQQGYRGTGMASLDDERRLKADAALHKAPEIHTPARVRANAPLAGKVYQNVRVLGDLPIGEFGRTMTAMADWVAGNESCVYCHVAGNFASDEKYTKVVARRMLQMVQYLNSHWTPHVGATGVTCYTCHRGQGLPAQRWFLPAPQRPHGIFNAMDTRLQNLPQAGLTALTDDAFRAFLLPRPGGEKVGVASTTALVTGPRASVQDAEKTYGLMLHISKSLGVNCTFCHNSRAFASWAESSPARVTAWQGLRMVRDVNGHFMEPLRTVFPAVPVGRLGPTGDSAKVNCATCHQGANKPLFGARMAAYYPALLLPFHEPTAVAPASAPEATASPSAERSSAPVPRLPASGNELMAGASGPVTAAPASTIATTPPSAVVVAAATPASVPAPTAAQPAGLASGAASAVPAAAVLAMVDCIDVAVAATKAGTRVAGDAVARQVSGSARLRFYSAPNAACEMSGVLLRPGESMEASVEYAGYTAVRYLLPQSSAEFRGWVRSERLSPVGGAVAVARAPAPAGGGADCAALDQTAMQGRREMAAAAARRVVTGAGRLQFHTAPDPACRQVDVYILTGEPVEALAEFGEFTRVRYVNPRSGAEAFGWVRSGRLAAAKVRPP